MCAYLLRLIPEPLLLKLYQKLSMSFNLIHLVAWEWRIASSLIGKPMRCQVHWIMFKFVLTVDTDNIVSTVSQRSLDSSRWNLMSLHFCWNKETYHAAKGFRHLMSVIRQFNSCGLLTGDLLRYQTITWNLKPYPQGIFKRRQNMHDFPQTFYAAYHFPRLTEIMLGRMRSTSTQHLTNVMP